VCGGHKPTLRPATRASLETRLRRTAHERVSSTRQARDGPVGPDQRRTIALKDLTGEALFAVPVRWSETTPATCRTTTFAAIRRGSGG
jgi:hypothetical protein